MSHEKNFKVKIGLNAEYEDIIQPEKEPTLNLRQAIQEWWDSGAKKNLNDFLNQKVVNVKYKSYLHHFTTSDTVDKEAYD